MHRFIAAFLVLLTLLMPGIGMAGGVAHGDGTSPVSITLAVDAAADIASSDRASHDRDSSMPADGLDLVDGPGDMPILLQSPRPAGGVRLVADALPSFRRSDAPSPWVAGLRRPPRLDIASA